MSKLKSFFSRLLKGGLFIFKAELLLWGLFLLLAAIAGAIDSLV